MKLGARPSPARKPKVRLKRASNVLGGWYWAALTGGGIRPSYLFDRTAGNLFCGGWVTADRCCKIERMKKKTEWGADYNLRTWGAAVLRPYMRCAKMRGAAHHLYTPRRGESRLFAYAPRREGG